MEPMLTFVFIIVTALFSNFALNEVDAAIPVSLGNVGSKEFFVLKEPMLPHYAHYNCTSAGLRLVEIYTEEENTFLKSSPGLINGTYYLTGGAAHSSDDAYYWETSGNRVDTEIFDFRGYNPNSYRVLFRAGQNYGDWFSPKLREFQINPALCQSTTPAIAKRSEIAINNFPTHLKMPARISPRSLLSQTRSLPFVGEVGKKKFYVENNFTLNYEEAWKYCNKFGFTLSSIESKEELNVLNRSQLMHKDRVYWTSGREHLTLPYFRWAQTQKRLDATIGNFNPIADSTALVLEFYNGMGYGWLFHIHDRAYILCEKS